MTTIDAPFEYNWIWNGIISIIIIIITAYFHFHKLLLHLNLFPIQQIIGKIIIITFIPCDLFILFIFNVLWVDLIYNFLSTE